MAMAGGWPRVYPREVRSRRFAAAVFAVWVSAAACGSFDSERLDPPAGDAPSDAPESSDAAVERDASRHDAPVDAVDAACATNPVAVPFDGAGWILRADATLAGSVVMLTEDAPDKRGAVWWEDPHALARVEVAFEVRLTPDGRDGFALVFVEASSPPVVGGPGGNMGVCGVGAGIAVAFDTGPEDLSQDPLRIKLMSTRTTAGCPDSPFQVAPLTAAIADGQYHRVAVSVDGTTVSVTVDGAVPQVLTLGGPLNFRGFVGITAATGAEFGIHAVRNPSLVFGSDPPCP
jgi:hypothetical protein